MADPITVYATVAALSDLTSVVTNALEIGNATKDFITRTLDTYLSDPEDRYVDLQQSQSLKSELDQETVDVIDEKIKEIEEAFRQVVKSSSDQVDWQMATDKTKSDICALLKNVKALNGGQLPRNWAKLWVKTGCV